MRLCIGGVLLTAILLMPSLNVAADTKSELAPLFTLPNLDGEDVSLADYRGSVVILDFWASWCHVCVRTFPEIHALAQTYAAQGVVLLVVCLDKHAVTARDYLVENSFPTDNVLWGSLTEAREVKDLFGVVGIAHTVLIDRQGHIRFSGLPWNLTPGLVERWIASSVDGDSRAPAEPLEADGELPS